MFIKEACHIGWQVSEDGMAKPGTEHFQLARLMSFPETKIGKFTADMIAFYHDVFKEIHDASTPEGKAESQPKCQLHKHMNNYVELKAPTFAMRLEKEGFIKVPEDRLTNETQAPRTLNFPGNYPPFHMCNLRDFSRMLGYFHILDQDITHRNMFHLIFHGMKFCWLCRDIALHCFDRDAPRLPGDYARALRQRQIRLHPIGYTPLHILCQKSPTGETMYLEVVQSIVSGKVMDVSEFATTRNEQVAVFFVFVGNRLCATRKAVNQVRIHFRLLRGFES